MDQQALIRDCAHRHFLPRAAQIHCLDDSAQAMEAALQQAAPQRRPAAAAQRRKTQEAGETRSHVRGRGERRYRAEEEQEEGSKEEEAHPRPALQLNPQAVVFVPGGLVWIMSRNDA